MPPACTFNQRNADFTSEWIREHYSVSVPNRSSPV